MTSLGGGADIAELLRRLGDEAIVHEAESRGLSPKAGRMRCPFEGCATKGLERERDVVIFAGGHPRIHCYSCGGTGDLVDLLQRTRGWTRAEALGHVQGQPAPVRPAPALRVVGAGLASEEGKLSPAEAKRVWDAMVTEDELGQRYLEGRGLGEAVAWVKYSTEAHPDGGVKSHARRGYRVAALLTDVVGNARGAQLRLSREPRAKEPKVISVKGSSPSRGFFGEPHLIEASPVVAVAEGLADTVALAQWVGGHEGVVVTGAAGMSFLPRLADELAAAAIGLAGKLFVLFPQNDRPANKSRREFVTLAQRLQKLGARVVMVTTPAEVKDVADWRRLKPDLEWPPAELQRAILPEPGDETPAEERSAVPVGCAVAIPGKVTKDVYAQDFTTLCALLDDASTREAIGLRGELSWCEMTWRVRVGKEPVSETDLSAVRLGLETQAKSTDGKPLRFDEGDIAKAMAVLARRKSTHPVREWLQGLTWDGRSRRAELAAALGHLPDSFEATLLWRWLLSAVARAMRPGCKVDTVLVLVGPQGAYKSTFFEALAGEFFTDAPVRTDDKDGKLIMRRAWVVEWAELDSMRRAKDQESVKAFLSARVDLFRKPYGREVVEAPRHCVIVGTTNAREFLHDTTGNRRFWPVTAELLDVGWVRAEREQLWAEARQAFAAGEQWWLTRIEEDQLAVVHKEHEATDPWENPIADWLESQLPLEVTVDQVLHLAVGIKDVESFDKISEMRAAAVLKHLGWTQGRSRQGKRVLRVYRPPEGL